MKLYVLTIMHPLDRETREVELWAEDMESAITEQENNLIDGEYVLKAERATLKEGETYDNSDRGF